jgi:hypothetical protein
MRMRNQLQVRHRIRKCVALSASQDDIQHKFLVLGVCVIASTIIMLGSVHLPNLAGSTFDPSRLAPQHLMSNSVNRLHKGDRIPLGIGTTFEERWSAAVTTIKPASLPMRAELASADMQLKRSRKQRV